MQIIIIKDIIEKIIIIVLKVKKNQLISYVTEKCFA